MKVYHVTDAASAAAIRQDGFVDQSGTYLTRNVYTGVWISDSPLDIDDMGGCSDFCFEIEVEEKSIAQFEWIEDHKTYREWLVPAEITNRRPIRELTEEQIDKAFRNRLTPIL